MDEIYIDIQSNRPIGMVTPNISYSIERFKDILDEHIRYRTCFLSLYDYSKIDNPYKYKVQVQDIYGFIEHYDILDNGYIQYHTSITVPDKCKSLLESPERFKLSWIYSGDILEEDVMHLQSLSVPHIV